MKPRSHLIRLAVMLGTLVALLGASAPALANVGHYDVRVDGLACPFCAYGLEKKLKALPGVSAVRIDLDEGRASFDVAPSTVLMPASVQDAVREAGFTPRGITVRASGAVHGDQNNLRLDVGNGQIVQLQEGDAFARLRKLVGAGHRAVVITGPMTRAGEGWQLRVDQVSQSRS